MFFKKNIILNLLHHSGVTYPVPSNITYWWNFGVLALVCLIVQLITGIFLAMHFVANADLAFLSVEHIMRDIQYGWLLRYVHSNGASMFFLVVYVHLFRGLYYGSYSAPRQLLWCTGVVILLIMILTAFMGYVLPWGQMSFWAATVITNLVSAIPYIGNDILIWLWGGFAIDNPTLNRFFSLHYLFPFVLVGLVGLHLVYLHEKGSNNALGTIFNGDKIPFTPYFTIKDIFGVLLFFIFFSYFIFFEPVVLGHPDNFIPANPLVTPNHIVPEWYFLPFYAILRAVPYKLFGFILLISSIIVLLIFPFLSHAEIATGYLRPLYRRFFWLFFFDCLLLGWIGGKVIEEPYYLIGQLCTIYYFSHFLIILPTINFLNKNYYAWLTRDGSYSLIENEYEYNPDYCPESNVGMKNEFLYGKNSLTDLYTKWQLESGKKNVSYDAFVAMVTNKKEQERKQKMLKKNKLIKYTSKQLLINKKYKQDLYFFNNENVNSIINFNNMLFFRVFIFIGILLQGPLLFNDGDRIPNTTILLVMFCGYILFTANNFFGSVLEIFLLSWQKFVNNLVIYLFSNKYWLFFNIGLFLSNFINFIAVKNIKYLLRVKVRKFYALFILTFTLYLYLLLQIIIKSRMDLLKVEYLLYTFDNKYAVNATTTAICEAVE